MIGDLDQSESTLVGATTAARALGLTLQGVRDLRRRGDLAGATVAGRWVCTLGEVGRVRAEREVIAREREAARAAREAARAAREAARAAREAARAARAERDARRAAAASTARAA